MLRYCRLFSGTAENNEVLYNGDMCLKQAMQQCWPVDRTSRPPFKIFVIFRRMCRKAVQTYLHGFRNHEESYACAQPDWTTNV
jgi:hypothetical protein